MIDTTSFLIGIVYGIIFTLVSYAAFAIYTYYKGFQEDGMLPLEDEKDINDIEVHFEEVVSNTRMKNETENLLADIRNKMSPASHLIALVERYIDDDQKTGAEQRELYEYIKTAIPKAKESIEYLRQIQLNK
jgi:hypothetical protein